MSGAHRADFCDTVIPESVIRNTILLQEVRDVFRTDVALTSTVEPLKRTIRLKTFMFAESLALDLKLLFGLSGEIENSAKLLDCCEGVIIHV